MTVELYEITIGTSKDTDIIDLTAMVGENAESSTIQEGAVFLFTHGSTAALTTIEYESGVIKDLKDAIAMIAPENLYYEHNERWGDGNGYSHVRASLLGPSLHIPLVNGRLTMGTWQQIVLLDFDNRPRKRRIIMQVIGD